MTKVDVFSGFLGSGKTTLIKKLIAEAYAGEKLVLIENEFGEIGIDGGFMQDAGIEVTEMNSGCICCSLVGDFGEALKKVVAEYAPERILIEPSGVGKLSDVIRAVEDAGCEELHLNSFTTVCDAGKVAMYMKNFGEFYNNQVEHAATVVLSHVDKVSEEKLAAAVALIREKNPTCTLVTTPLSQLTGAQILAAMEHADTLEDELKKLAEEEVCPVCGHHHHEDEEEGHHHHHEHHHHDHDEECCCGHDHDHEHHHDHDHDEECCCGHDHDHEHHHDHDHDEECCCGHDHDHEHHHHDHDEECCCGHDHDHGHHHHDHHGHGHHHHHHADEVFQSFGRETAAAFDRELLTGKLAALSDEATYGVVLRAKGIVRGTDGGWIHFDYVPGEPDIRSGSAAAIGRLCVIGAGLKEEALMALFGL